MINKKHDLSKEELEKQIEVLSAEVDKLWNESFDRKDGWEWYTNHPKLKKLIDLKRDYKLIKDYVLVDIDKSCGDLIPFDEFVNACKVGPLFSDYDGFGRYATEDKESDISISPSDIIAGKYRKDFTHVMWYSI